LLLSHQHTAEVFRSERGRLFLSCESVTLLLVLSSKRSARRPAFSLFSTFFATHQQHHV
jgi:hypothetical protein